GVSYRPDWVRCDLHPNQLGAGWAEFREVWTSHKEKPDGLIITDDILAPDVCTAIHDLGLKVPDQLMLVAYSNKGCPFRASLPLTKLEYDTDAHAREIGELLLRLLQGDPAAEPHEHSSNRFRIIESVQ